MNHPDDFLRVAEEVLAVLARHHLDAVVIGAVALAAHHYVRQTEVRNPALDLDEVRAGCARYRLGGLEELIAESRLV